MGLSDSQLDLLVGHLDDVDRRHHRVGRLFIDERLVFEIDRDEGGREHRRTLRRSATAFDSEHPGHRQHRLVGGSVPAAVESLLEARFSPPSLPSGAEPAPMQLPGGTVDALDRLLDLVPGAVRIRALARRATVVGPRRWARPKRPGLLELRLPEGPALLVSWERNDLELGLQRLLSPAPRGRGRIGGGRRVPVLFRAGVSGALLHELVGHTLEADLAAQADEPLLPLGELVAPTSLDLVDDPGRFDLPGGFDIDDLGEAAETIELLRGGRVVGLLLQGRARRDLAEQAVQPRMSNLVAAPGRHRFDELEGSIEDGIVVERILGARIDPCSGRVEVETAEAWRLRSGRRCEPLVPPVLLGSARELLARLAPEIGNDPEPDWHLGWCVKHGAVAPVGAEAPSLLFEGFEAW